MNNVHSMELLLQSDFDISVPIFLDMSALREFAQWSREGNNSLRLTQQIERGLEITVFEHHLKRCLPKSRHDLAKRSLIDLNVEIEKAEWSTDDDDFAQELASIYFHDSQSPELYAQFFVMARRESRTQRTQIITKSGSFQRVLNVDVFVVGDLDSPLDLPANFDLFTDLSVHPRLRSIVLDHFNRGDYMGVVQESVKELYAHLRDTDSVRFSGKDGWALVQDALFCKAAASTSQRTTAPNIPKVKFSTLSNLTEESEHKGYYHLIGGTYSAFRNVSAHHALSETARSDRFNNKKRAIKILCAISLFMEKIDSRVL